MRPIVKRFATIGTCLVILSGCAMQRAQLASEAKERLVGQTKEQVLGCMGPPANKMAEGTTEVWSYASGNGQVNATGAYWGYGASSYSGSQLFCTVNLVMQDGRVSRVNYIGPTGTFMLEGEQCAFAVESCVQ